MTQLEASLKKEIKLFVRTGRFIAIVLVLLGLAFLDVLQGPMMKAMGRFYDSMMGEMVDQLDMTETFSLTEILNATYGENIRVTTGVSLFTAEIGSTVLIVTLILLINVAGSEQKKRATIIPACSGLKINNYLLAKFLLYPITSFLAVIAATVFSLILSSAVLVPDGLTLGRVLLSGFFNGLFLSFLVCIHLLIGLSSSRPGISATVIIVFSVLIRQIALVTSFLIEKYNPFSFYFLANYALYYDVGDVSCPALSVGNIAVSLMVTAGLIIAAYFITLFALNSKRVDNSGNDILL